MGANSFMVNGKWMDYLYSRNIGTKMLSNKVFTEKFLLGFFLDIFPDSMEIWLKTSSLY